MNGHNSGHLLYLLAVTRELARARVFNMPGWLSTANCADDLVYYVLSAVLAAVDLRRRSSTTR